MIIYSSELYIASGGPSCVNRQNSQLISALGVYRQIWRLCSSNTSKNKTTANLRRREEQLCLLQGMCQDLVKMKYFWLFRYTTTPKSYRHLIFYYRTHNFKLNWCVALFSSLRWSVTFDQKIYPYSRWGAPFWTTPWKFTMHFLVWLLVCNCDVTMVNCCITIKQQLWRHQISLRKRHWLWLPRSVLSLEIHEFGKEKDCTKKVHQRTLQIG